jgi:ammonia channel protein AmtB
MPHPSHSFDLITKIIFGEESRSLSSSQCSLLRLPVTSFVWGLTVFLSFLFSNTLRLGNQVSRPHKTTVTFTVVCFSLYVFGYQIMLMKIFKAITRDMKPWISGCS